MTPTLLQSLGSLEQLKHIKLSELPMLAENVRGRLRSRGPSAVRSSPADLEPVELFLALQRLFDPSTDRLFWETGSEELLELTSYGRYYRMDWSHESGTEHAFPTDDSAAQDAVIWVRHGRGMATALGALRARANFNQDHWVVVVLDADTLPGRLGPQHIEQLKASRCRFLVIVLGERTPESRVESRESTSSVSGLLALDSGLCYRRVGPVDGRDIRSLVEALHEIKAGAESALLRVNPAKRRQADRPDDGSRSAGEPAAPTAGGRRRSTAATHRGLPNHQTTFSELAREELLKLARSDPRLVVMMMDKSGTPSAGNGDAALAKSLPDRTFTIGDSEPYPLTWCGGLAVGGCRPVVVLSTGTLRRHLSHVIEDVCRPALPVLFLLDDGDDGPPATRGAPAASGVTSALGAGLSTLDTLRLLPHTTVLVPGDDRELLEMLQSSLKHDGPTILVVSNAAAGPRYGSINGNGQERRSSRAGSLDVPAALLDRERRAVLNARLTSQVEACFRRYSQVGRRPRYVWQWCVHGANLTTLPCVLPKLRTHVRDTKVLSIMLCVLLDDCADVEGNEVLLEALLKIIGREPSVDLSGFSDAERRYAEVTRSLSDEYESRIREYPCYPVFEDLLRYDQLQYFNTMRFSNLLNRHLSLLNSAEHDLYLPHAMHMMSFATLDLMCTPTFRLEELGKLREAIWYAQCMGRIGNLLSTWQREIAQRDFTSGVFARAVMNGDLSIGQLETADPAEIEAVIRNGGHEQHYFQRWRHFQQCFQSRIEEIHSVDLHPLIDGQERFFYMHLACRGRI